MKCRRIRPVRHRDAGICRYTVAGGYTRHNGKRNAVFLQYLRLFSATSKDERIAAFETHHLLSLLCKFHQQPVGLTLLFVVIPSHFSGKNQRTVRLCQIQHRRTRQRIIDHGIRLLQAFSSLFRQQRRVSRTGAHQKYTSCFHG